MFSKHHLRDRAASRRTRFVRHVRDVFSVMTPVDRDDRVLFIGAYVAAATLGLVCSLFGWSALSASGTFTGVLLTAGIALVLGPLAFVVWGALIGVGIAVAEFMVDETDASRTTCRELRHYTRRLRRALRTGGSTLDGFTKKRSIYQSCNTANTEPTGPWSRLRARRVERLRARLRTRLLETYDGSLDGILARYRTARNLTSTEPLDTTPMVWTSTQPQSIAALRVLETHAPLTGCITENRHFVAGTTLVFAPKWVYDVVVDLESARASADPFGYWMLMRPRYSSPPRSAQCVALQGADPETVAKLYEPHGDGPFADLAEVVRAAQLV